LIILKVGKLFPVLKHKPLNSDEAVLKVVFVEPEVHREVLEKCHLDLFNFLVGPDGKDGNFQEELAQYPGVVRREVDLVNVNALFKNAYGLFASFAAQLRSMKEQIEEFLFLELNFPVGV